MRKPKELPEVALERLAMDLKQAKTKAECSVPLVAGFPEAVCGAGGYRHWLASQFGS